MIAKMCHVESSDLKQGRSQYKMATILTGIIFHLMFLNENGGITLEFVPMIQLTINQPRFA